MYNVNEPPRFKLLIKHFVENVKKIVYLERLVEEFHIIIKLKFTRHLLLVVEFLNLINDTKDIHHIIRVLRVHL